MSGLLGAIRSHNGIVIISDSESDPSQNTAVFKINDKSVAAVFRNKNAVKDFLDKYILPKKPQTIQEVLDTINTNINEHLSEYSNSNFSFMVAGYENGNTILYDVWFDHGKLNSSIITTISHFISNVSDLADYIITKVFSEQMTIEELRNLIMFIALQCIKVFGMHSSVDLTTISKEGVNTLSEGQVRDKLSIQDHIDHKLKKIFSDFFVKETLNK